MGSDIQPDNEASAHMYPDASPHSLACVGLALYNQQRRTRVTRRMQS
jgi:hypothetical protein